jgi:predicted metal-dependent peptidase
MTQSLKERMTKTRVKLLKKSPFFGTLLINAPWREDESVPTAATDGKGLMFNPKFMETLNEKQMAGVVLQELARLPPTRPAHAGYLPARSGGGEHRGGYLS